MQLSSREVLVLMYNLSTISSSQLSSFNPPIFNIDNDLYKSRQTDLNEIKKVLLAI